MGKSEVHYGSHKKEEKVRPECSICILYVLNSLFPNLLATRIVEIEKVYIKKVLSKTELGCHPQKKVKIWGAELWGRFSQNGSFSDRTKWFSGDDVIFRVPVNWETEKTKRNEKKQKEKKTKRKGEK